MGVKSTVDLSRSDAELKFAGLYVKSRIEKLQKKASRKAAKLSNKALEDKLMRLNDKCSGGEGFENYYINDTTYV